MQLPLPLVPQRQPGPAGAVSGGSTGPGRGPCLPQEAAGNPGRRVKLDTNGSFPERLKALAEEKLVDYVAMDIKNGPSHYGETIGIPGYLPEAVEESKNFLLTEKVPYEFRTTVVRGLHTEESLLEAAEWIRGAKAWYLQQFRDSGALICGDGLSAFSEEEMQQLLHAVQEKLPAAKLRGL